VYGYRRSLWAEHLNVEDERFKEPWSVECMREVRRLAEENWKRFAQEEVVALPGHLLLYPLQVESSGKVVALSGYEAFPDVGGSVLGYQTNLPDSLTC
jgi:phospholipase D1/2